MGWSSPIWKEQNNLTWWCSSLKQVKRQAESVPSECCLFRQQKSPSQAWEGVAEREIISEYRPKIKVLPIEVRIWLQRCPDAGKSQGIIRDVISSLWNDLSHPTPSPASFFWGGGGSGGAQGEELVRNISLFHPDTQRKFSNRNFDLKKVSAQNHKILWFIP